MRSPAQRIGRPRLPYRQKRPSPCGRGFGEHLASTEGRRAAERRQSKKPAPTRLKCDVWSVRRFGEANKRRGGHEWKEKQKESTSASTDHAQKSERGLIVLLCVWWRQLLPSSISTFLSVVASSTLLLFSVGHQIAGGFLRIVWGLRKGLAKDILGGFSQILSIDRITCLAACCPPNFERARLGSKQAQEVAHTSGISRLGQRAGISVCGGRRWPSGEIDDAADSQQQPYDAIEVQL